MVTVIYSEMDKQRMNLSPCSFSPLDLKMCNELAVGSADIWSGRDLARNSLPLFRLKCLPTSHSRPSVSWARLKSKIDLFPSGFACVLATQSTGTQSVVTGAAPSSTSKEWTSIFTMRFITQFSLLQDCAKIGDLPIKNKIQAF